jgi:50S ribosomal subunit-associated GTPase HflX
VCHPECQAQLRTVLETLAEMECDQPTLLVANKIDRLEAAALDDTVARLEETADCRALRVSARTGTGLRDLRTALDALAGRAVPETRANRPVPAAAEDMAGDGEEGRAAS